VLEGVLVAPYVTVTVVVPLGPVVVAVVVPPVREVLVPEEVRVEESEVCGRVKSSKWSARRG
jgi:hypothetical protein